MPAVVCWACYHGCKQKGERWGGGGGGGRGSGVVGGGRGWEEGHGTVARSKRE